REARMRLHRRAVVVAWRSPGFGSGARSSTRHRLTRLRPSRYTNHIAPTDVIAGHQERSESLAERNRIASLRGNSATRYFEEMRCLLIRSVRWSCIIGSGHGQAPVAE